MATILTCRVCMADFALPEGLDLLACPACGAMHSRPQAEGDALDKLQRGTRLRLACEFAAAEKCYDHVLMDHDDEHEALWGRLLCLYGVEHVVDSKTGARHPLVHCPRRKPLQEQADFQQACELAPAEVRAQYEADAAYIDDAQAEIRSLAEKCPPYDVFLCHKTTRLDSDAKTEDYNRAFMLYHKLDKLGYRVFFAPVEMEGVAAGANYEAAIYHALHTARVMLVICSDPAYISSTWVQSEWKRYLELVDDHADRCLLPLLYGSLPAGKLPREYRLRKIEAVTMEGWDAQENVLKVLNRFCGEKGAAKATPVQPAPVQPKPVQPAPVPNVHYSAESHFQASRVPGGCAITKYTGPGGQVDIPPMIGGMPVVEIGEKAFEKCQNITGVNIPEGVVKIATWAFIDCSGMTKIRLSRSVAEIAEDAFNGCSSLKYFSVDPSNRTFYVQDDVLYQHGGTLLRYPEGRDTQIFEIPEEVIRIGVHAFGMCRMLQSVNIPESVKEIGRFAFYKCANLRKVTLKDGVKTIGNGAFYGCSSLENLMLPTSVTQIGHRAFTGCGRVLLSMKHPCFTAKGNALLTKDECLMRYFPDPAEQEYSVPAGVDCIDSWAFEAAANLTSVTIPEDVRKIGGWAFERCVNLKKVTIWNKDAEIAEYAFSGCPALTLCVLPESTAHTYARQHSLPFELINTYSPESDFQASRVPGGCTITKYTGTGGQVDIPPVIGGMPVVEIAPQAFWQCETVTGVVLPDSVTGISEYAFGNCYGLTKILIPKNVKRIGSNPFSGCSALRSITVENGNAEFYVIEDMLFSRDGTLLCLPAGLGRTSCNVPPCVRIGAHAFNSNRLLTDVSIREGTTEIGTYAFSGCSSLRSLHIPGSVTKIGPNPCTWCSSLRSVTVAPGNPQYRVADGVVFSADMSVLVFYPAGLSAENYRIPESVEVVNACAFADCKNLRSVTFPKGVRRIGADLFKRCENVTMRVYPGTEAHIYAHQNKIPCEQLKAEVPFEAEPCDGGCMLTRYTGPADCDIRIPQSIDGKPVVDLGQALFPDDGRPIRAGYIGLPATLKSFCTGSFRGVRPQAYAVMKDNSRFYSSEGVVYGKADYLAFYPSGSKRTEYAVREGTKFVFDWGFRYAENLTTLTMPASLKQIRQAALADCPKLRSVTLPEGLERIEKYAFWNCPSLTTLTIPAGTTISGEGVFGKCPNLTLRVHEGSPAHEYARANNLRFEVLPRAGAAGNAQKAPDKPVSQPAKAAAPAEITYSELLITRSKRMDGAIRKIAVRIDGKEVGHVGNGEHLVVKLNPGTHRVDIKLKPLMGGDVHWDSMWTVKDIFKENMLPGKRYTIDLADWLRKLFV